MCAAQTTEKSNLPSLQTPWIDSMNKKLETVEHVHCTTEGVMVE